ncbi:hypothetical protein HNY73_010483 [Argiope bruennichi]|uniref:Uncharacterized protein n=2 Tax=Argiope bruennichi TaxID=94029 RepID=A0A8T0F641_ARGBR|nr:hypothetical protein HNY73_010483 [Argiope bruennichi]
MYQPSCKSIAFISLSTQWFHSGGGQKLIEVPLDFPDDCLLISDNWTCRLWLPMWIGARINSFRRPVVACFIHKF